MYTRHGLKDGYRQRRTGMLTDGRTGGWMDGRAGLDTATNIVALATKTRLAAAKVLSLGGRTGVRSNGTSTFPTS